MPFSDFLGNPETLYGLRAMLARKRFPHAVILPALMDRVSTLSP